MEEFGRRTEMSTITEESDEALEYDIEEEGVAEEEAPEESYSVLVTPTKKTPFKFNTNDNGNILTVHHKIREGKNFIRVKISVCSFNERSTQFIVIDKRGNVFVFDLENKLQWKMPDIIVNKAISIKPSKEKEFQYFIGTNLGYFLKLDTDKPAVLRIALVSDGPIEEISFPRQINKPKNKFALLRSGHKAILFNLTTFKPTHRLEFENITVALKIALFMPLSDQIFTCYTNDSVNIWSGATLNTLRIVYPIKLLERKMRLMNADCISTFILEPDNELNFSVQCQERDYSSGKILSCGFKLDGRQFCLTTIDGYLLLLNSYTYDLERFFRLKDFIITECIYYPHSKDTLIFALTKAEQVLLLDCDNCEFKMVIEKRNAISLNISGDGKLLSIIASTGEAAVWSTCRLYNALNSQKECIALLRDAFKQPKPVSVASDRYSQCFNDDVKKLLKRDRLLAILREFGCYPLKYRRLIWCTLLHLPYNNQQFEVLVKLGIPDAIRQRAQTLKLKNDSIKRSLIKVWSCLAHWCKVFAYSDIIPGLIFPFVFLYQNNSIVAFEICATLILNHFQLWFEFHPMQPTNYLGICENLLQHYDKDLWNFYKSMEVDTTQYAWSILVNGFSEVLDEEQMLCLWDNILSAQPYFPIFVALAYNILQREIIVRLPDKASITFFFKEQNPIDVAQLIFKAFQLCRKCPTDLHPKRYMSNFQYIPKGVYPKFLKYPKQWLAQHEEELVELQKEHNLIDQRIRELEVEDLKMQKELEKKLQQVEHVKRVREMEKLYQDTIRREEYRVASQRKLLILYQKEIRNRQGKALQVLQEAEERKKTEEMEKELEWLRYGIEREQVRNSVLLSLAEDEVQNQDMEIISNTMLTKINFEQPTLKSTFYEDIKRLAKERDLLHDGLKEVIKPPNFQVLQKPSKINVAETTNLEAIEREINEIQKEFLALKRNEE